MGREGMEDRRLTNSLQNKSTLSLGRDDASVENVAAPEGAAGVAVSEHTTLLARDKNEQGQYIGRELGDELRG